MEQYVNRARLFKALSDPNRLKIIEILSCGERCACDIQSFFEFTQPTLSHHMKILMNNGLVTCRKDGQWNHYGLNTAANQDLIGYLERLVADTDDCICKSTTEKRSCSE